MPTFLLKRFNKMRIAYALFIENQRKDLIPGIQTFLANPDDYFTSAILTAGSSGIYQGIDLKIRHIRISCSLGHQPPEFLESGLMDIPRQHIVSTANRCRQAYHLSHHCSCPHDSDRSESNMAHTDVATSHHHIVYILAAEASERNRIEA